MSKKINLPPEEVPIVGAGSFVIDPTSYTFSTSESVTINYSYPTPLGYGYFYGMGSGIINSDSATNASITFPAYTTEGTYTGCYIGTYNDVNEWITSNKFVVTISNSPTTIPVTSVSLNKNSHTFTTLNATTQLTATINPNNATDKTVTWKSSNTNVATVSVTGLVTAKSNGSCVITVTTNDGSKTATCNITVNIPIPVTGVTLNKTSHTFTALTTTQLSATIAPANATNKTVTWSSSNASVATVSNSGVVTAKANGTCTITVTTNDGNKTATCNVTVDVPISVVSVSLDKTSHTFTTFTTQQLTAIIKPSNATNKTVTWSSSNINVAAVSATGLVTAKTNGTCVITVTTNDGKKTATCNVDVNVPIPATSITVSPSSKIVNINSSFQLTESILPTNATNKSVTWSSSNTSIAIVSNSGLVTAKGKGECIITVTTNNNKSATCSVIVNVPVTGVSLDKSTHIFTTFTTTQLSATVLPANANNKGVTWSSSNTNIATVSNSGLVTAKTNGSCTITVTTSDGNKTATCSVTVNVPIAITGITINPSTKVMNIENTYTIVPTILPTNATNKALAWSSSNTNIATVSNSGLVTAKEKGSCTITATSKDGSNKSATCSITVVVPVVSISFDITSKTINIGNSFTITATVLPVNANNKEITWSSSNENICTVSNSGLVTTKGKGNCTITATSKDGSNKSATCSVTVNIPVTGITLNETNCLLQTKDPYQLIATILPENANNKNVTWSSDNTNVATVSNTGLVTPVENGSCVISATTIDGNKTAKCNFRISIDFLSPFFLNYKNSIKSLRESMQKSNDKISQTKSTKAEENAIKHFDIQIGDAIVNKDKWNIAYEQIKDWANETPTGSTEFDGNKIKTGTIFADKIAISDFNNYSELNKITCEKLGFSIISDSSASNNPWFKKNKISKDNKLSKWYKCNGGESLRINADISTTVYGQSTSGGTATATGLSVNITIFTKSKTGTNGYLTNDKLGVLATSQTNATVKNVNSVIKLGDDVIEFAIYIQIQGYPSFSGDLKIRNASVHMMSNGQLIVDGSITTNMIHADGLNAEIIKAGEISADRINGNTIVSKVNDATTSISGDKIRTGILQANTGGSYLNLNNGSMLLGAVTNSSYLQWTGSALTIKATSLSIGSNNVATTVDVDNAKTQAILDAVTVKDTRNTNENPIWYITNYPKRVVYEFKTASILGVTSDSTYGHLETKVPWSDKNGGYPTQTFVSSSSDAFTRRATSDTEWTTWIRKVSATQDDVFNTLTNNLANQGIYLEEEKLYVNASMINTGTLSANVIATETLNGKIITGGSIDGGTITGSVIESGRLVSGSISGTTITGSEINVNDKFIVTADGTLKATGAEITGKVTISAGSKIPTSALDGSIDITQLDGPIVDNINSISGMKDSIALTEKYIDFVDGEIILGDKYSQFKVRITNTRIDFLQNNTAIAYISNNKLYITEAEIKDDISIGNFAWTPRSNGNMSLGLR